MPEKLVFNVKYTESTHIEIKLADITRRLNNWSGFERDNHDNKNFQSMFFVFRHCSSPQISKTKELNQNFQLETWTIWKQVNNFGWGVLVGKVNYRDKQVHMSWMSSVFFLFCFKV